MKEQSLTSSCAIHSAEPGFTLIEIMVTLVIISVGLLALGLFTVVTIDQGEVSRERLSAVHLAERVIEGWQHNANDQPQSVDCTGGGGPVTVTPVVGTSVNCTPVSGVAIPYSIKLTTSRARAPLAQGNPARSIAFGSLTWQGTATSTNAYVKVVKVTWAHKGKPHSVFLTHITGAK